MSSNLLAYLQANSRVINPDRDKQAMYLRWAKDTIQALVNHPDPARAEIVMAVTIYFGNDEFKVLPNDLYEQVVAKIQEWTAKNLGEVTLGEAYGRLINGG